MRLCVLHVHTTLLARRAAQAAGKGSRGNTYAALCAALEKQGQVDKLRYALKLKGGDARRMAVGRRASAAHAMPTVTACWLPSAPGALHAADTHDAAYACPHPLQTGSRRRGRTLQP